MTRVGEALDEIETELHRLGCRSVELLVPAVPSIPGEHRLPAVVQEFFSWRGGTKQEPGTTVGDAYLIPGYRYPSLDEALALRKAHGATELGSDWIPLLIGQSGDCFAAVWSNGSVEVADVLIGEPTEVVFDSVEELLDALLDAFRSGAFFVDGDGWLALDPVRFDPPGRPLS